MDAPKDLRDVQPTSFSHVIGQRHVTEALKIAVDASFQEGKRLDDFCLCGPPGLGKTALVSVVASELAVPFTEVLAQSITSAAELNSLLLSATGVLFLDEIHLLHPVQQHALLQVIDERRIFISGGKAVHSLPVNDFTLVGATTNPEGVIQPLMDRFRMVLHLDFYSSSELRDVVRQRCRTLGWDYEPPLLEAIAQRAKGTPRIALRLLQSARRVAVAEGAKLVTVEHLSRACAIERISDTGLDHQQQKYLQLLESGGSRLGVLAAQLGVAPKVVSKTIEPYLLRAGLILKDEQGRRHLAKLANPDAESRSTVSGS